MVETIYQVAPRYTPGSPAQVDAATASRVAAQEADTYRNLMAGAASSTSEHQKAVKLGLEGIVEMLYEQQHCWHVTDVITGKESTRPFEHQLQQQLPATHRTGSRLAGIQADLLKVTAKCSDDMHEPPDDLKCHVVGDHLDNAFGGHVSATAVIGGHQEYVVCLEWFDGFKQDFVKVQVNLADLIAMARMAKL